MKIQKSAKRVPPLEITFRPLMYGSRCQPQLIRAQK